jgi:hypothetical protein
MFAARVGAISHVQSSIPMATASSPAAMLPACIARKLSWHEFILAIVLLAANFTHSAVQKSTQKRSATLISP